MTSIEATLRLLPSLSGDTDLGFQHLAMPTPERSVDTSSVLQPPPLLPSLGAPYNTIGAALFSSGPGVSATRANGRHQEQEREQVPLRTNRQATPRVGNGETASHARTTHQTVVWVREVAAPHSSGHGAPASSQRQPQAATSSVAASSSQNRRLSTSTNSTSATSNTTAATTNGGRSSQQPAASGKRKREPQNLLSTVRRELNEQSRYREIHASERFLQQQLDAEKEARRLERDERTALNTQVERLQCRNDETLQRFEAQKERLVRQHEEVIARMKAKNSELKTKIETLQEKLADERDKSRGLENANTKLEIQLAGSRGFSKH
ncbi:hypothetical protein PF008_g6673 [Phytophthora fragariae]|uniref:Uncharacterized protein n=1 Tax=Phytophthora fragariae TaxID=53985 RepID=A0A6G0S6I6_9STRA|nr:hypothetical protein PF008_g6673 [Phytophthora fragariae]